jgi:glucose-6-phosphate 1-dehydrogenase
MAIERVVLFGASGDLTSRLVMPAIAQLANEDRLPAGFHVVGSANTDWTTADFQEHIRDALAQHAQDVPAVHDRIVRLCSYQPSDVTDPDDVSRVVADDADTLVYLALPSVLLERALTALASADLSSSDAIAIEKPFGTDLTSAQRLNEIIRVQLPKPTIFRVDHFLSSELVRRIVTVRFANRAFEPTLNAALVERIDIYWLESLALEGRADYYDRAGALKDMLQNHLMETMALVLMAQPARLLDASSFRDARVEALRAIATPTVDRLPTDSVRARYGAGRIGDRDIPAYIDEPGVEPQRGTETYAALTLHVDNARWGGVPITLRSGKALAHDEAEIAIHYRGVPTSLRQQWEDIEPNVLKIGLMAPTVSLGMTLNGPGSTSERHELAAATTPSPLSAYANLFVEMLSGNPRLFIRGDEAEEAWRIIDPVVDAWAADQVVMQEYPAGGEPPAATG